MARLPYIIANVDYSYKMIKVLLHAYQAAEVRPLGEMPAFRQFRNPRLTSSQGSSTSFTYKYFVNRPNSIVRFGTDLSSSLMSESIFDTTTINREY